MSFQEVNMAHPQRTIAASTAKTDFLMLNETSTTNDKFGLNCNIASLSGKWQSRRENILGRCS